MRERVPHDELVKMMNRAIPKSQVCDDDVAILSVRRRKEPVEGGLPNWEPSPKVRNPGGRQCRNEIVRIVERFAQRYDVDWED